MSQVRERFSFRRMVLGMAFGAVLGVFLYYLLFRDTRVRIIVADEVRAAVSLSSILAVLGGVAGSFLKKSGWMLFAGGIVGAIVTGVIGVIVTLHPKGLIYSIFGGPLGVVIMFLHGINHEVTNSSRNTFVSASTSGVWDRELDG